MLRAKFTHCRLPFAVGFGAAALTGCQPAPAPQSPRTIDRSPTRMTALPAEAPSHKKVSPDQLFSTDPSAIRLHDIGGAMLYYFALNKRLPPTLQELQPFADDGSPLDFTSPVNHQPYGYAPNGLSIDGRIKRIVAYDPVPTDGRRWCIFMTPTHPGGRSQ